MSRSQQTIGNSAGQVSTALLPLAPLSHPRRGRVREREVSLVPEQGDPQLLRRRQDRDPRRQLGSCSLSPLPQDLQRDQARVPRPTLEPFHVRRDPRVLQPCGSQGKRLRDSQHQLPVLDWLGANETPPPGQWGSAGEGRVIPELDAGRCQPGVEIVQSAGCHLRVEGHACWLCTSSTLHSSSM